MYHGLDSKLLSSLFRMTQYIYILKGNSDRLFPQRFIVTLGWILGKPLTLLFDPYESVALFLSGNSFLSYPCMDMTYEYVVPVLTVNYVVQDGKSNWLEGLILMGMFSCLYSHN